MSKIRHMLTGGPRPIWIRYLLIIGFFTLLIRTLMDSQFRQSALLYILVPYLVSVVIYLFVPQPLGMSRLQRFFRHMLAAFIVMLATSALLFEGFICVIMFLPIYLLIAAITFALMKPYKENPDKVSDTFSVSYVPMIMVILSVEGITPSLSFERQESITRTQIVQGDIDTLKANMAMPIHMEEGRSPFLSLFPLPTEVKAGSLNTGDIHKAHFVYNRWGIANTHEGDVWIEIADVGNDYVRTKIVKDTSYFSNYLTVSDTLVKFEPISETHTQVSLTVNYQRDLDPAWYFGPMQRAAISESADYLIEQVIARPRHGVQP